MLEKIRNEWKKFHKLKRKKFIKKLTCKKYKNLNAKIVNKKIRIANSAKTYAKNFN